ncbi:MAG: coenzyme F420-0:L-glutamate ligase [Bacillota bacterium]|jgi:hypothetical protein
MIRGKIPIRTHVITPADDIVEVVKRYAGEVASPGDVVAVAESAVAISQGRAVPSAKVRYGRLAAFLCRFAGKEGSLATPQAMQLAIQEVGVGRILAGCVAAALGRLVGRRGDFYRVAGRHLALIDDVAGTMCSYEGFIVLGPRDPERVAEAIKEATGLDVAITDVNDARRVDIIGATAGVDRKLVEEALLDNPFGNDDQQTPIVVLKKAG